MSCRRCGEEEDFCGGIASEELCKHCLDHVCTNCFNELETEKEEENMLCSECDEPEEPIIIINSYTMKSFFNVDLSKDIDTIINGYINKIREDVMNSK